LGGCCCCCWAWCYRPLLVLLCCYVVLGWVGLDARTRDTMCENARLPHHTKCTSTSICCAHLYLPAAPVPAPAPAAAGPPPPLPPPPLQTTSESRPGSPGASCSSSWPHATQLRTRRCCSRGGAAAPAPAPPPPLLPPAVGEVGVLWGQFAVCPAPGGAPCGACGRGSRARRPGTCRPTGRPARTVFLGCVCGLWWFMQTHASDSSTSHTFQPTPACTHSLTHPPTHSRTHTQNTHSPTHSRPPPKKKNHSLTHLPPPKKTTKKQTHLQPEHRRADLRNIEEELQQRVGVGAIGQQIFQAGQRGGVVARKVEAVQPALGEVDVLGYSNVMGGVGGFWFSGFGVACLCVD
jgi:hypothetical protein